MTIAVDLGRKETKQTKAIPSECQTVWIQIRPNVLSGLIWVQSVCKSYQQTALGGTLHADLSSKARGLKFCQSIHPHLNLVCANSKGSGETAHLGSLV